MIKSRGADRTLFFSFLRWWRVLREPYRVLRVYGTPLLTGGFWWAPVKSVYSVQKFLDGVEDGEELVLILCFDLLRKRMFCGADLS